MKKRSFRLLYLTLLFLASYIQTHGQRSNISFGITPNYKVNGYGLSTNFNYHHNPSDYFQLTLTAAFSNEQPNSMVEFPFEDYLMNLGYYTTVLRSERRGISIFFGGGPAVGYEITKKNYQETAFTEQRAANTFVFGAFASFEMDFYLTDTLSLVVPTTGIYHYNSEVEEVKLLLGLGLRVFLN
ncbi:conjugal transfer protein TraO [Flagellimonas sp.]|uniref:conjugal transfer protein TraO n=1 Tax=Flagellimonas sp. TaxID=2058762 RepID=UPI003F4A50F6